MHFHEQIIPKYTFTYKAPGAFSHDLSASSISVVEGLPWFSRLFDKFSVEISRPLSAFEVSGSSWSSKKQGHNVSNPFQGNYFHITFNFMQYSKKITTDELALEIFYRDYSPSTTPLVILVSSVPNGICKVLARRVFKVAKHFFS